MNRDKTQVLALATLLLAALGLESCASKTASVQPPGFLTPKPTRQAINAIDAGDGDLELASLRRNMANRPNDVDARLKLAQAYENRGFYDVALEHYRLAAERFPDAEKVAVKLAVALRRADQKEEALEGLKAFLHAHPQTISEPYEWQGILNDDLQNWKDSQLAYETALMYSPNSAELHNNLGYALLMQFQTGPAAAEFRAALRIKHDMAIARNNLGIALAGDRKEAILNWQSVSGPAAAHNNMAALLIEHGDYAEARKELSAALEYDRHNPQALYNLALVSERDGKPGVVPPPGQPKGNFLTRHIFPWRYSGKPTETQTLSAGQPAGQTMPASGTASSN